MRALLKQARKIVVKAGTSILTGPNGRISTRNFDRLGTDLMNLMQDRRKVVLVSSGAIGYGMDALGLKQRPKEMPRLQACAAIGQSKMMHAYEQFFLKHDIQTAQLLLTRDGLETRKRFLGARHTFAELLRMGALPIVNENDTVATEEIAFGDNDILSVHVAHVINADLLVILSDVEGFFLKDGSRVREVPSVSDIDNELVKHLKDVQKQKTVGGMRAKLEAARVAMRLGVPLMLVNGHEPDILAKVAAGEDVGTLFLADSAKKNSRSNWIAFSAARRGRVIVDNGAYEALRSKKRSLLPSGMTGIEGHFDRGEVVELSTPDRKIFGRGVVKYSSRELAKIAGKKTHEIQGILGYKYQDEVIHRNDLVLWG